MIPGEVQCVGTVEPDAVDSIAKRCGLPGRRALARDTTIDITTIGRRSGVARRIEIWFLNVGGTIYITGTSGTRDWFANLLADPTLTFHLKESVAADLPAVAENVVDPAERRAVFGAPSAEWYREQEDLEALVAHAPMVRITFADDDPASGDR